MKKLKQFETVNTENLSGYFEYENGEIIIVVSEESPEVSEIKKRFHKMEIETDESIFSISISYLKELVEAIELIFILFPNLRGKIKKVYMTYIDDYTISEIVPYFPYYDLVLNDKFWLMPDFRNFLRNNALNNYFSTSTIFGNIDHEMTHSVEGIFISKKNKKEIDIATDWNNCLSAKKLLNRFGFNDENLEIISSYAKENYSDALAEVIACVISGEIVYHSLSVQIRARALLAYIRFYLLF